MDEKIQIGTYSFRRTNLVGSGGMANVYWDYHPVFTDTRIAIKEIKPHLLEARSDIRARFISEAKYSITLRHENIVAVYDVLDVDNRLYIVMDYIDGSTLKAKIENDGPMPLNQVARFITDLAKALDYIHGKNFIHRDVKSSNIMVQKEDEKVLLMDFGIIKNLGAPDLTIGGEQLGTPEYMSPEQARGDKPSKASDIYALGIVAYEMLTGNVPFKSDTPAVTLVKHISEPIPPLHIIRPELPYWVIGAVERALSKNPFERFSSASEFADAISGESHHKTRMPADLDEFQASGLVDTPDDDNHDTAAQDIAPPYEGPDKVRIALTTLVVLLLVFVAGTTAYLMGIIPEPPFILSCNSPGPPPDFHRAKALFYDGEYKEAKLMFREVMVHNPDRELECSLYIGMSYYEIASSAYENHGDSATDAQLSSMRSDNDQAIQHLESVVNVDSSHSEASEYLEKAEILRKKLGPDDLADLERAKALFYDGEYEEAIPMFREVMVHNPDRELECSLYIGMSYYEIASRDYKNHGDSATDAQLSSMRSNNDQAIQHLESVVNVDSSHSEASEYLEKAEILKKQLEPPDDPPDLETAKAEYYAGRYRSAIRMFEQVMAHNPDDRLVCNLYMGKSYYNLASSAFAPYKDSSGPLPPSIKRDNDRAIQHLEIAFGIDSKNSNVRQYRDDAIKLKVEIDNYEPYFHPPDPDFQAAKAKYDAAHRDEDPEIFTHAAGMFKDVIKEEPALALQCNLYIGLSYYYYAQSDPSNIGWVYSDAVKHLTKVLAEEPFHKEALMYRANANIEWGQNLIAPVEDLERYKQTYGVTLDFLHTLAFAYEKALDYDKAIETHQEIIKRLGSYNAARRSYNMIMLLAVIRNCDLLPDREKTECEERRRKAREFFVNDELLKNRSDYYYLIGRVDLGNIQFDRNRQWTYSNPDAERNRNWDSAIRNFERTIELFSGHDDAFRHLMASYRAQGRYPDEAIQFFTRLANESQDSSYPLYRRALIYADTGDKTKAKAEIDEIRRKFPNFVPAKTWLEKN